MYNEEKIPETTSSPLRFSKRIFLITFQNNADASLECLVEAQWFI